MVKAKRHKLNKVVMAVRGNKGYYNFEAHNMILIIKVLRKHEVTIINKYFSFKKVMCLPFLFLDWERKKNIA